MDDLDRDFCGGEHIPTPPDPPALSVFPAFFAALGGIAEGGLTGAQMDHLTSLFDQCRGKSVESTARYMALAWEDDELPSLKSRRKGDDDLRAVFTKALTDGLWVEAG